MPLVVDGRLDGQRGREQEAAVAAAEGVAVDVRQELVPVLLGHGYLRPDAEVWLDVAAPAVVFVLLGEAEELVEGDVGD